MSEKLFTILRYSHHFSVAVNTSHAKDYAMAFAKKYAVMGLVKHHGQWIRIIERIYAAANRDRTVFRFHKNQWQPFVEFMGRQGVNASQWDECLVPMYEPTHVGITVRDGWTDKDYQTPIVEYLCDDQPNSKMVALRTGGGKGYVTLKNRAIEGTRTVIVVQAKFMEKWHDEIVEIYKDVTSKDIMMVQGSKHLKALLWLAKSGELTSKFIIISNKTIHSWLKDYDQHGVESLDLGFACLPYEFYETLGAGCRVIDELHLDYHLNFRQDLYTHIPKTIGLSATLLSEDPFQTSMYELAYPLHERWDKLPPSNHIYAFPVYFRFDRPGRIRTAERGDTKYSHNAFEESLMENMEQLENYLELIGHIFEVGYLDHQRPNKRCLILCYTTKLCTLVVDFLKLKYPHLNVKRYVSGDEYEDLMTADVSVSTIGSAGTAVDIEDLVCVILTQAITSIKSNVQSFGRLRELKGEHSNTLFYYFVCTDFGKHMEYDVKKQDALKNRSKGVKPIYTGRVL